MNETEKITLNDYLKEKWKLIVTLFSLFSFATMVRLHLEMNHHLKIY